MALAPWSVLAAGKLRTDAEEARRRETGENGRTLLNPNWERNEDERKMSKALEVVAGEVGTEHISAGEFSRFEYGFIVYLLIFGVVAIAYLMQKTPYVFPIIGGRKPEQLLANVEALNVSLTPAQVKYLEDVIPFDLGFPGAMIVSHTLPSSLIISR